MKRMYEKKIKKDHVLRNSFIIFQNYSILNIKKKLFTCTRCATLKKCSKYMTTNHIKYAVCMKQHKEVSLRKLFEDILLVVLK